MTNADWDHVEQCLQSQFQPVGLVCDGYHLCLCLQRMGMKLVITFFVNGDLKGRWLGEDCEERRRFFRPVKKSAWTAKSRLAIQKTSKRMLKRLGIDPTETITVYYPWWNSFKALKSHLRKHNECIELVKNWRYAAAEGEAL
ncbi:hypothetical protein GURASL_13380 [Geotalea uraniireducens]|uniref:Transposase n=1 Tax=Geotalea uraniireducens TaxID=351604 RepID=A0ABN6VQ70_9BACT|nr:hypothetical protein [Geotalea uraniireducens]BDV42415.1 hypothetical protein GURASL_13380 [Geotalea uraniireducens]